MEPTRKEIMVRMIKIHTMSFTLQEAAVPAKNGQYNFTITVRHAEQVEQSLVHVLIDVDVFDPEREKEILSKLEVNYVFNIEDFPNVWKEHNNDLPIHIRIILNSISISTTRGIFYAYVKGTYLENAILPIVDPQQMVPSVLPETASNVKPTAIPDQRVQKSKDSRESPTVRAKRK